jgi:signal transduction histidine kinase/ActR/RegA family two-component response regulator
VEAAVTNESRRHHRRATHHDRRQTLRERLAEAEDTLQALRQGDVDALVVRGAGADQVYTLHGAEEPYRNFVEQIREGAVVLTPSGDILYSNARFASLVGEPLESLPGGHIGRFIADADRAGFAALLGSGNGTCRSRMLPSGGSPIEVYLSLTTTVSSKGIGSLSLIVSDLSEIVEARNERDRAERDSRTKNEFVAILAHELRNPVGAIRSAAAVLGCLDTGEGAATRARAVIGRQVAHLSHLIEDLLDVERFASGKIRLDLRPVDMAKTVERAVRSVTERDGLDRHIEISTDPMWIDGDAVRLDQILSNLVTNAVKYTPPGGRIRVSLRAEGGDAVLRIQDSGFGIPADLLPAIFDMFVQGERTVGRAEGGLGIGLALVRRLVELHRGTVVASSDGEGQGSTFTVRLPQVQRPTPAPASTSPDGATPKRVIIIEDSGDAREMFRMVLELAGHTVYEAESGERGLELVEAEHPDVAIVDIGLPGLDGYQIARRIRDRPSGSAMLLLALTGYGLPGDYKRSADAGFDHHLVKPVDPDAVARLVAGNAVKSAEMRA